VKDYLAELVRASPTPAQAQNVAREYLQARILGGFQRAGAMIPLGFHGGTALRFLYASARYSEDLDFALEQARSKYDLRAYLQAVRAELAAEGYAVALKVNDRKVVHSAFVRFAGLPYELGLSPHRDQALAVKVEVDTNPPAGAVLATTVVRRYVTLQLQHHDRASLLAGKLHAILQRPYLKGRDVYDLLWYLSDPDWPAPNLTLLTHALEQTGWTGDPVTEDNWRALVRDRLQALAWDHVLADVRPFLEPSADLGLLTLENVQRVLGEREEGV
jgi:predicted nucleotidyltransferase component of viral defense system